MIPELCNRCTIENLGKKDGITFRKALYYKACKFFLQAKIYSTYLGLCNGCTSLKCKALRYKAYLDKQ